MSEKLNCHVVRPEKTYDGLQGFRYFEGISKQNVGSSGICMHLLTIPPGGRAKAHLHENHETTIYVLKGEAAKPRSSCANILSILNAKPLRIPSFQMTQDSALVTQHFPPISNAACESVKSPLNFH